MHTTAEKTNHSTTAVQKKAQQQPTFFRKAGEESFFGTKEQPHFFSTPVQAKLTVSSPDDPQEKEADAVADQVMRMPEPTVMAASNREEEKVQRKEEEEKVQTKPEGQEEEKKVQPKIETPSIPTISRMAQVTPVSTKYYAKLYRSAEEGPAEDAGTGTVGITSGYINCKHTGQYPSDIIQRNGRGPPTGQIPLEQSLASTKGGGSALPSDTRQFMETRFNADFSGVRIHTDATARSMSSSIHAQAFAHGNDIYFNEGKYAPHTEAGGTLLAHELTHTIQQGASSTKGNSPNAVAPKLIARKNTIHRSVAGVPEQLTNAVVKAKTVEGKIDANKPGPDGNRTGWEHLVEIFKTTFGEDKIVSGSGGTSVKGAVAGQDIKKKRTAAGAVVDTTSQTDRNAIPTAKMGERDAMPSWCGIFVFWALNKSGVPMPKWKLGERMIKLEAARPPGVMPLPGDIAYRNAFSHFAIVESVNGGTVTTVNGNTAGEDNLGGQVQTKDHPLAEWTAFFNPLLIMQGNLGSGEGAVEEKPKSFRELRQELFHINRKTEEGPADDKEEPLHRSAETDADDKQVQTKPQGGPQAGPELGNLTVNTNGALTAYHGSATPSAQVQAKAQEEEQVAETETPAASADTKLHASLDARPPAGDNSNTNTTINSGIVQAQAASDELQAKQEEQREEKATAAPVNLQAKACCDGRDNEQVGQQAERAIAATGTLQAKATDSTNDNSSLTNEGSGTTADSELHDRGPPVVVQRSSNTLQRGWFSDAIDAVGDVVSGAIDLVAEGLEAGKRWVMENVRDLAMNIPGYLALRVVLESDPITGEYVARNGRNFIQAAFDIMPGGRLLHQKLEELGALDEAAQWIDNRIADVASLVSGVVSRIERFIANLSLDSLASPSQVLEDAGSIIYNTIRDIIRFAENAATELLAIVKRWLLDHVVSFIKEHTTAYPLLCVILGQDPIKETPVERNGTTILSAILELGGEEGVQQRTQMQETGTFQKAAAFIDEGISVFGDLLDTVKNNVGLIWSVVSIDALMHPIDTFTRIYETFAAPVRRVLDFMRRVGIEILRLIKEVLMVRLSNWAKTVRGYFLVTVIIGKDPFTGAAVPRNVANIIHGFMSLMDGGEEQYQQMVESGAIARTTQRINAAVAKLNMTPASIIQLFIDLWNGFSLNDLAHPIDAFQRIIDKFGEPIGRLIAFIIEIVKIVVVVILEIMNFPFALINNIITKAMLAFDLIKRDPIGFLKNLLRAIKEGFMQFFDNILTHLFNGLKAWFLSEVQAAGIPIPTDFTVMGIIKWLLAVLDVTMEKIWKKLEDRIGKPKVDKIKRMVSMAERVADAAGEAYTFIKDVQERGFMAVMVDKLKEQLSNVWEMVLDAVKGFVMDQIIKKVTTKLLSMLDPTGIMAVINSAIALYKAIQSFIKYLRQMLEIVNSFVEGTLQIAQGATKKAADFLEGALARGIPIVIGFLANQVGLDLSGRLKEALEMVREKVDKGLTWVIDKVVGLVERLVAFGRSAVQSVMDWARGILGLEQPFTTTDGAGHRVFFRESGDTVKLMVNPVPAGPYVDTISNLSVDASGAGEVTLTTAINFNLTRNGATDGTIAMSGKVQAKDLKENALKTAHHLDNLITSRKRISTDPAAQAPPASGSQAPGASEQTTDFVTALQGLSNLSRYLFSLEVGGAQLKVTEEPTYGGLVDGFGKSTEVKILTKNGVPGSTVSVSSDTYQDLLRRKRAPGSPNTYYIGGHLLSNELHGSGATWQNITPIANSSNTFMESSFESDVKKAVKINNKTVALKVWADYPLPKKTNLQDEIKKDANWESNPILLEKNKIIEAEAKLPNKIFATCQQLKDDGTPETDATKLDSKINFTGREVLDHAKYVTQTSLNDYFLSNAAAVAYKSLKDLKSDATAAVVANEAWLTFIGKESNKRSVDNLTEADRGELLRYYTFAAQIKEQNKRIENLPEMQTWASFIRNWAIYDTSTPEPTEFSGTRITLKSNFDDKIKDLKKKFFDDRKAIVEDATFDPNEKWGDFARKQGLVVRPGLLENAEIQDFRTNVFDKQVAKLKGGAGTP